MAVKSVGFMTNKWRRFHILNVKTCDTKIGGALNSKEDADRARATSGIDSNLSSSCYETVIGILREGLRNDQLR
jgi:uncharacterized protein YidB (DUF937 family)